MPKPTATPEEVAEKLTLFLQRAHNAKSVWIDGIRLLTGGASRQTWSFDATIEDADGHGETLPLVARADPRKQPGLMPREVEYRLLEAAHAASVAVPKVHLMGDDSLGAPFFLMERVEGETIARRILRDNEYASARKDMAAQLGGILATIHRISLDEGLREVLTAPIGEMSAAESELTRFEATFRSIAPEPHPAFELAIRWLKGHLPPPTEPTLVHGDYRMGNLIVGPEGVRSVLDWELAHLGDPMEDLAWMCVRSWRFGNDDKPVGGVGQREDYFAAYEAAGGRNVDKEAVHWWEVFGNLRWGVICIAQARAYLDGFSKSVELATIGRRTAETEWEILNLIEDAS